MKKETCIVELYWKPNKDTGVDYYVIIGGLTRLNLCEVIDSDGQPIGCHKANCYTLDNKSSSMRKDIEKDFEAHFSQPLLAGFYSAWVSGEFDKFAESLPSEHRDWIKDYIKDNTKHTAAHAFWYSGRWWVEGLDFFIRNRLHDVPWRNISPSVSKIEADGILYKLIWVDK